MSATFCESCQKFNLFSFTEDNFGLRGYRCSTVRKTAELGCSFCKLLVATFRDEIIAAAPRFQHLPADWQEKWWIHFELLQSPQRPPGATGLEILRLRATLAIEGYAVPFGNVTGWHAGRRLFPWVLRNCRPWGEPRPLPSVVFNVAADPESAAATNRDIIPSYAGETLDSPEHLDAITRWVAECTQAHPRCNPSDDPPLLPTRCVDVSGPLLRLVEFSAATPRPRGRYITLSHRWTDQTEACRTTTANHDARVQGGFDASSPLPKVFTDAANLVRQLAVSYIWIDSLCIIQEGDDGADWRREAPKMADYYQNSLLTVAATLGTPAKPEDGLFPPRETLLPNFACLPYRDRDNIQHGYFYVYSTNRQVSEQYRQSVLDSHLLTRGWVFQEWLLSARIVCFTPHGLYLECRTEEPRNERYELVSRISGRLLKRSVDLSRSGIWYEMVASYSALALTHPDKDRIVALFGMVSAFNGATLQSLPSTFHNADISRGQRMICGLWAFHIHFGLLWQRGSSAAGTRIARFSTWSWASISTPITWEGLRWKPNEEATLIDITFPSGAALSPSAGPLELADEPAELRLRCRLIPVIINGSFDSKELQLAQFLTGNAAKVVPGRRKVCAQPRPDEIAGWASIEHPDFYERENIPLEDGVFALPVLSIRVTKGSLLLGYIRTWHPVYQVLLVRRVRGDLGYERVGMGMLFGQEFEGLIKTDQRDIWLI